MVSRLAQKSSKKRNIDETSSGGASGSGQDHKRGSSASPKKDNKRGDKIINKNMDEKMKIPADLKYGDIFHPEMRKGFPAVNHDDGTIKCNNYHHRGFCYSKQRTQVAQFGINKCICFAVLFR